MIVLTSASNMLKMDMALALWFMSRVTSILIYMGSEFSITVGGIITNTVVSGAIMSVILYIVCDIEF